jgi:hypothetical protein
MKIWGLLCSYIPMTMWIALYIWVLGGKFLLATSFDLLVNIISLLLISIEIYLTYTYLKHFTKIVAYFGCQTKADRLAKSPAKRSARAKSSSRCGNPTILA